MAASQTQLLEQYGFVNLPLYAPAIGWLLQLMKINATKSRPTIVVTNTFQATSFLYQNSIFIFLNSLICCYAWLMSLCDSLYVRVTNTYRALGFALAITKPAIKTVSATKGGFKIVVIIRDVHSFDNPPKSLFGTLNLDCR